MPRKTIGAIELHTPTGRLFFIESTKHTLQPEVGSLLSKAALQEYYNNSNYTVFVRAERKADVLRYSKIEHLRGGKPSVKVIEKPGG